MSVMASPGPLSGWPAGSIRAPSCSVLEINRLTPPKRQAARPYMGCMLQCTRELTSTRDAFERRLDQPVHHADLCLMILGTLLERRLVDAQLVVGAGAVLDDRAGVLDLRQAA